MAPFKRKEVIDLTSESDAQPSTRIIIEPELDQSLQLSDLLNVDRRATNYADLDGGAKLGLQKRRNKRRHHVHVMSLDGTEDVVAALSIEDPESASKSNIHNLPGEILANVCKSLDAIWILNLSHSCKGLHFALNGKAANKVWYDALPAALFAKKEQFQKPSELCQWAELAGPLSQSQMTDQMPDRSIDPSRIYATPSPGRNKRARPEQLDFANLSNDPLSTPMTYTEGYATPEHRIFGSSTPMTAVVPSPMLHDMYAPNPGRTAAVSAPGSRSQSRLIDRPGQGSGTRTPEPVSAGEDVRYRKSLTTATGNYRPAGEPENPRAAKRQRTGTTSIRQGQVLPERKIVKALGGPFEPLFDYKREIVGHLNEKKRCFICLNLEFFPSKVVVSHKQWGFLWCTNCLHAHTTSLTSLTALVRFASMTYSNGGVADPEFPYENLERKCISRGIVRIYNANIDEIFVNQYAMSLRAMTYSRESWRINDVLRPDGRCSKVTNDYRKTLRWQVVLAAEKLWDGVDPLPTQQAIGSGENAVLISVDRSRINPLRYEVYRTRFAPTRRIREFLYTAQDLPDNLTYQPDLVPGQRPHHGFPIDFTRKYCYGQPGPSLHEICFEAEKMLDDLVRYRHAHYYKLTCNYGGSNTTWMKAVNDYHTKRVCSNLATSNIMNSLQPWMPRRGKARTTLLEKLRFNELSTLVDPHDVAKPLKTVPSHQTLGENVDNLIAHETRIKESEHERKSKLAAFRKIAVACCKRCPDTGMLLSAKGINGLLNHMRVSHAEKFWETDSWDYIG